MGRHSSCYKQKLRKGLWSPEEDDKLIKHITKHGHGCWSSVPKLAGNFVFNFDIEFQHVCFCSDQLHFCGGYVVWVSRTSEVWEKLQVKVD